MPHLPETLYSSNTLDVIAYKQEASAAAKPLVVISFQPRGSLAAKEPWGAKFLLEAGYAVVGIQPKQNHWYQPLLQADVRSAVRTAIDTHFPADYSRLTYGSSMGAYAALRFAADLGATKAFALSPPARTKVWARWQNDVEAEIDPVGPESVLPDSHVLIACDPMLTRPRLGPPDAIDARNFQSALSSCCTVDILECPNFGHPVTKGLSDRRQLKSIFLAFADESRVLRPDISSDVGLGAKELRTRVRSLVLANDVPKAIELLLNNREIAVSNKKVGRVALVALRKAKDTRRVGTLKQELSRKFGPGHAPAGEAAAERERPKQNKRSRAAVPTTTTTVHSNSPGNANQHSRPDNAGQARLRDERRAKRKANKKAARENDKRNRRDGS